MAGSDVAAMSRERIDTGYLRGVLDSTGRLTSDGYITDYWRKVVKALCAEIDTIRALAALWKKAQTDADS